MRAFFAALALTAVAACSSGDPLSVCHNWSADGSWDCRTRELSGADLSEADLTGRDLTRADLTEADLSEADLSGADLAGVMLREAQLGGANLEGAVADKYTWWIGVRPSTFDPEAAGVIFED